ncbi:S8 family serine peptidase [Streptomyces sp. N35]|uniref:S8 family serine peptidase n=1 Tax=Streptomyces sp. N35 TaxID=2795730 RepID=UPI0018F5C9E4|nr:S8 family serine peptidase [Streptomyces sp. N35]
MGNYRRTLHVGLTAAVLGGLLTSVSSATAAPEPKSKSQRQKVIVELDGATALEAPKGAARDAAPAEVKAERKKIAAQQTAFLAEAKGKGIEPKSVRKLGLLLNAVAMTVTGEEAAQLKKLPGVRAVHPDTRMKALSTDANELVGNPELWKREDPSGAKVTGKGVTVAVIDSGIDYTHPDLGGGFGKGHKVVGGYDFINNDADPMDDNRHGTHVAGIVAGKAAADGGVTGAAPDAELLAYKVLDSEGYGDTSAIVAGIEAAVDPANPHRPDIINMSLGGPGDGTDPLGQAATRASESGVLVIAAAGNSGPGRYSVGSPAAAKGVIAVGASTSGIRVPEARVEGGEKLQTYRGVASANPPAEPLTGGIANIGYGSPEEWEAAGDVSGKTVLYAFPPGLSVNELTAEDHRVYREAEKRGAVALIGGVAPPGGGPSMSAQQRGSDPAAALLEPGAKSLTETKGEARIGADSAVGAQDSGDEYRMDKLVVLGVDQYQGQDLAALAASDAKARLTVSGRDSTDEIASFSSRGPDPLLGLKPDIVAPGVEIRSTVPKAIWEPGIQRMSGTSMASPLVAGSAALLRQLHPDKSAAQLGADLTGSAKHLDDVEETTQGAGRPPTAAPAGATVTAPPPTLSFRLPDMDGRRVHEKKTVTVHNSGSKRLTGAVKVSGKAEAGTRRVSIPAGGSTKIELTLSEERPEASTLFSGRVSVEVQNGPDLTVPYLMTAIPLYVEATPDPTDGPADVYVYAPTTSLEAPPVLTITPPNGKKYTVQTRPTGDPYYHRADVTGSAPGVHKMTAKATTATGVREYGEGAFEVAEQIADGSKWQPIGPNSADGRITLAPSQGGKAVMTQYGQAGTWLTTDSGESWKQHNRTPFMGAATNEPSVVIDAKNPERMWSATSAISWTVNGGGIMRSDDSGKTWERLNAPDLPFQNLVADQDTKVLVAQAADYQAYVSRDAGESWAVEDLGISGEILNIAFGGDDLYAWTGNDIWAVRGMSGSSPQPAEKIYSVPDDRSTIISGFDADAQVVAVRALGVGGGLTISQDGGRTWSEPYRDGRGIVKVNKGDIYYDPLSSEAEISKDGGRTWTTVEQPNQSTVVYDYDRWADGSHTISAASTGIFRSSESGYRRIGVQGESISSLAVSGGRLMAGTGLGLYSTELPARSPEWGAAENEGSTGIRIADIQAYAKDEKIVWRSVEGLFGSSVQKSEDSGKTWTDKGQLAGYLDSLMVDPRNPDKVIIGFHRSNAVGVYTTTDGGEHWKSKYAHRDIYSAIAADPDKPGRIWLGGLGGLYYSDDFGGTVTNVAEGEVSAVEFDGSRMIVGGKSLRYSTDGGKTLRESDEGGLRIKVSDIVKAGDTWYAGTTSHWVVGEVPIGTRGVLRSTDGGRSWHSISSGMQNTDVLSLAVAPDDGTLYVGTQRGGVHSLNLGR